MKTGMASPSTGNEGGRFPTKLVEMKTERICIESILALYIPEDVELAYPGHFITKRKALARHIAEKLAKRRVLLKGKRDATL